MSGFIVLRRHLRQGPVWTLPGAQRAVALELIFEANYEERTVMTRKGPVTIPPGSLILGREEFARKAGVSVQTFRTTIRNLKNCGFLTSKSTSSGTIVSLTNPEQYRGVAQSLTSELTSIQPAANQQVTTPKEIKKERKKENTCRFDLEGPYKKHYPTKLGAKSVALKKLRSKIRTDEDYTLFVACLEWMAEAWRNSDTQYCPRFTTFANQELWRDRDDWPRPSGTNVPAQQRANEAKRQLPADRSPANSRILG